jgi:peptidoglycan glycosyltransferase
MTRNLEAALLAGAAALTAFGVALVEFARGGTADAQSGLTFLTFALSFGLVHISIRRFAPHSTTALLPPVALVAAFGFIEVYRLDQQKASLQRWWLVIGAVVAVVVLTWTGRKGVGVLRRYRNLLFLSGVVLLLMPLLPDLGVIRGTEVNGSRLWIELQLGFTGLSFQPAELAKLAFVGFLAAYLADRQPALTGARRRIGFISIPEPRQLLPLLLIWVGSLGVLVSQRDLGASLFLFSIFIGLIYSATGQSGYLSGGLGLMAAGGFVAWRLFDHVQRRVTAWLDPFSDFAGAGYQVGQGIFALGTGSLAGSGPGQGRPDLIPQAITDFIFAAVGEEFGFAGSVAVLCGYALIVAAGFGIALASRDRYRKLLATGLTLTIGIQTFLIIGGVLRVVPLTGITLPFMSYGGSSLVGNFVLIALLARISHEEAT